MADVEALTSSVVREYLSRKGLKDTLNILDKEMPRTENGISNRNHLAKVLNIHQLMKENSKSKEKYRTMLEVIIKYVISKILVQTSPSQSALEQNDVISPREQLQNSFNLRETEKNSQNLRPKSGSQRNQLDKNKEMHFSDQLREQDTKTNPALSLTNSELKRNAKSRTRRQSQEDWSFDKETFENGSEYDYSHGRGTSPSTRGAFESKIKIDNKSDIFHRELDVNEVDTSESVLERFSPTTAKIKTPDTAISSQSGIDSQVLFEKNSSKSVPQKDNESLSLHKDTESQNLVGITSEDSSPMTKPGQIFNKTTQSHTDTPLVFKMNLSSSGSRRSSGGNMKGAIFSTGLQNSRKPDRQRHFQQSFAEDFDRHYKEDKSPQNLTSSMMSQEENVVSSDAVLQKKTEKPDWKKGVLQTRESKKTNVQTRHLSQLRQNKSDELIFEDVDDDLDEELSKLGNLDISRKTKTSSIQGSPITLETAKGFKTLIFGSPSAVFNQEWRYQGFSFCENQDVRYGIVQHKGGPCGLLASVQAVLLKCLLFGENLNSSSRKHLKFSTTETKKALCLALTEIIWRAGSYEEAFVALRSEKEQFYQNPGYKFDGITEKLMIYQFTGHDELESFITDNISQLSSDQNGGCISVLYSAVLSRSIRQIKEDMDDPNGTLMGAHGYCTQDMVNLLLTGKAVSNTFDNVIELDSGGETKSILTGVEKQSDIGLLSLFEHYKSCLVGLNFKSPKYPIWVVCSESHFSVLFSLKKSILNERRSQKRFDLYYYDGLARQDEEIRLTIELCNELDGTTSDELTPPLELCIRTKWKNATVDWNGTDPLL